MRYIDKPELLRDVLSAVQASPWVAIDTEGDSLHHYVEKLCLVQLSVADEDLVIDPLASLDLNPLMRVLEKKSLILHGADFDLRILKKNHGFNPADIFDTMIAAQLLGYEKQGLADLAHKHCAVSLPKSAQKADWSERPLDETLLTYAANDTHFLKTIAERMIEELKALGRLDWHRQCCQKLLRSIQASKEKTEDDTAWQIKGSKILRGPSLTILKELWHWREEEAKKKDRPPFKVLNSEILIDLAKWAAENAENTDVALMPKAPRPLRNEYQHILNETIKKAKTLPQVSWDRKWSGEKPKPWSEESKAKLGLLKVERDKLGKELAIQSSLLATNAILEALATELPKDTGALERLGCLMPWQVQVTGERFLKILQG